MTVMTADRGEPSDDGRALARHHVQAAIDVEVALMKGSTSDNVRLAAAEAILNRACGRPPSAPNLVNQQDDFDAVLAAADAISLRRRTVAADQPVERRATAVRY